MGIKRRELLELLSASTFTITAGLNLQTLEAAIGTGPKISFPQGVASGDPTTNSIVLWTRAMPINYFEEISLIVEVSSDENFLKLIARKIVHTGPDSDYTVRTILRDLETNTTYYYRFIDFYGNISRIGRTRTAPPLSDFTSVKLGFVSCQNYQQGFFSSWARMIEDDKNDEEREQIQFILHLGDFIYERVWHELEGGEPLIRKLPAFPEGISESRYDYAISLADYRHLYKTYLNDPWLQTARARWPFICIWDDHEFSNDCFQGFSTYGNQPKFEPDRKRCANQAWFEFIPALLDGSLGSPAHEYLPKNKNLGAENHTASDSLCIYRKLRWGGNVEIFLTDNRSYRSAPSLPKNIAEQLDLPLNTANLVEIADYGREYNNGKPPTNLPYGNKETPNPFAKREPRTCLGKAQREWLISSVSSSKAPWKIWANSIPIIPLQIDMGNLPMTDYENSLFTIDPWSGFPYELNQITSAFNTNKTTGIVSLSGDHHMHGAGKISINQKDQPSKTVCLDFSVAGISSTPLFKTLASRVNDSHSTFKPLVFSEKSGSEQITWNMTMTEGVLASFFYDLTGLEMLSRWLGPNKANKGLKYVDSDSNGYGLATFSSQKIDIAFITMPPPSTSFNQIPDKKHVAHFSVPLWKNNENPQLREPTFDGEPPFPFKKTNQVVRN